MRGMSLYGRALAIGMLVLIRAIAILPLALSRRIGKGMGVLLYAVLIGRRKLAMDNVEQAFGATLTQAEKRRIVRGAFENIGIVGFEFPHSPKILTQNGRNLVEVIGFDDVDLSKGAIFTCSHLANWEWMAPPVAAMGIPIAEVVNTYKDEYHEHVINEVRRKSGITTVPKTGAVNSYLHLLEKGMPVGIISDQSPRRNGVPATLFGRKCWATPGPAIVAMQSGAPIHHATLYRKNDGNYVMEVSSKMSIEPSGDAQQDIQNITQEIQTHIERAIRAHPEQWLWAHDRWKIRHDAELAWNARESTDSSNEG